MTDQALFSDCCFVVEIPTISTIGWFTHCSGLELTFDVYDYREGGNNDFVHRLPGGVRYPNLILSRGLTDEEAFLKWLWATHTKAERKEITLTLQSAAKQRSWAFADAFPVRWTGPEMDSHGTGVATETLEIAHSGLRLT
jgi:phage tail-like protein